jgi:hypothetical protein
VVDVKVRMRLPPRDNEVDELLEDPLLLRPVEGPVAVVGAVRIGVAEEVLDTEGERVRVALEVEEEVAGRGGWEGGEAEWYGFIAGNGDGDGSGCGSGSGSGSGNGNWDVDVSGSGSLVVIPAKAGIQGVRGTADG